MTEREREARRLRLLRQRLGSDRETTHTVHQRVTLATERTRGSGPDPVTVGAVALYLQNLYTSIEEILRRVADDLDGSVPSGDDWHRELLGQMALELPEVRPRLLSPPLRDDLDVLRRFRHLVRHAYAADFDWEEMQSAIEAADRAMAALPPALDELDVTLEAAIRELERH